MNNEEMNLLKKTAKLAEENGKILRGLRRNDRVALAWKIGKWVVIAIVAFYVYAWLQPVLKQMQELYSSVQETQESIDGFKDDSAKIKANFEGLFKQD